MNTHYPGPCSAPLHLSRSLRGLLISQWYLSRPGAWPMQSCNQSYDPQDMEFNLCGQKPAQVFLEPLDHEEKCFRNQKVAQSKRWWRELSNRLCLKLSTCKKHIWAVFTFLALSWTETRGPIAHGLEETPHISVSKSQASPGVFLHSSSSILVTRETFTQRETQNVIVDLLFSVVGICIENISTYFHVFFSCSFYSSCT